MTDLLSPEMMAKVRLLALRTRRLVNSQFADMYKSVFKGQGMIFDTVRPYADGDDVRNIDWNVTARSGELHIKTYIEERELSVMILLDSSASLNFGTRSKTKHQVAAEIGALMAGAALVNNDRVGLMTFSTDVDLYIEPKKGRNHIFRLTRELMVAEPTGTDTNIAFALDAVYRSLKQVGVVIVISDFLTDNPNYSNSLHRLSNRHDVLAVILDDVREQLWRDVGLLALRDAETGELSIVDTSSRGWRDQFEHQAAALRDIREQIFLKTGVDSVTIRADEDYVAKLAGFLQRHRRRV